jgi:ABC-type nitrate/sulfonate/bicarbonate transport systems, periplasmic components
MGFRARLGPRRKNHLCLSKSFDEFFAFGRGAKEKFLRSGKPATGIGADSPAVAIPGLTLGSVDYTTVLGSTIAARMRGVPLVITGVFADKPMDFLLGAKGIASPKDLKGKIIGISALGTATHFLTVRVLKAVGLDPEKDVTLRAVGDEGLRLQALSTGLVQASLLGSQGVIEGEKAGLKVIVAAADVIESLPFAGVTTTLAKLKENPQQIKRVLRAGLRGLRYVQDNKAGTVDVIQSWYRVEREIAASTYDLARSLLVRTER